MALHGNPNLPTAADVAGARLGDPEAYYRLVQRFRERLLVWIDVQLSGRLRRRFSAEDVLQETFIAGFGALDRFQDRGPGSLYAWLREIARNKMRDGVRKAKAAKQSVAREVDGDDAGAEGGTPLFLRLAASITSPSGRVSKRDLQRKIAAAIQELPGVDRQILVMRVIEERTLKEVAEASGKSIAWAHGRFASALKRLREEFGDDGVA